MEHTAPHGVVLYDDACGFCRRWVPFWGETLRKNGFSIAPLQSAWVAGQLRLSEDETVQDLRLLLPDGGQVAGANVYRYVMKRIWWTYPIYFLSVMPVLRDIFDWSYRTFAKNRYRISDHCGWRRPGN
jgi:predicted DCC family thiol-disulfide oxidoreductase YuxK